MELYKKYRPQQLAELSGNKETVKILTSFLKEGNLPHSLLITGPKGCGKTTIGRILKNELKCDDFDFKELDTGIFRGIDTVRDIRKQLEFSPMKSPCRVWLLDECFPANTMVKTANGSLPIQQIKPNQAIISLHGVDKVVAVCEKEVPLERLIYLNFGDTEIITTKDHLFFTAEGWKAAKSLMKKDFIFSDKSHIMENITWVDKDKGEINEKRISLQALWKTNKSKVSELAKKTKNVLFPRMYQKSGNPADEKQSRWMGGDAFQRSPGKSAHWYQNWLGKNGPPNQKKDGPGIFSKDAKKQSNEHRKEYSERPGNQKNKWNFKCLFRDSWGEWFFNRPATTLSLCFGVACGGASQNHAQYCSGRKETQLFEKEKSPDLLQNRYSQFGTENRGRGGWGWSSIEREYINRSKKDKNITTKRLENSQVYQSGDNEQYFKSVIGDKERNSGYLTMYDLQVENHPSYFVNEIPVHNCHMLGRGGDSGKNEAQNALLKALEDTPKHVYFILCTTNPEMLLSTIRSRCVEIKVEALTPVDMLPLLKKVLKAEKKEVDKAVLMKISRYSEGSCRNALQLLDKVIAADLPVEQAKKLVESESLDQKSQVNELCQALLKDSGWGAVKKILQGLKTEDPESIRRGIIGYAGAVLLNGNESASIILGWFLYKNTYDAGFPLITQFCYNICQGVEPPC